MTIGRINAGQRLDGMPTSSFHRRVMWLVGMGMFFDSFDNTLSGSVLASMLNTGFSTLQLNSVFLSATFIGLAVGAAFAGWLSDRFGRSFAFQFNLLLFGGLALVCSIAPSMEWLIAIRLVMGVGMGAEYVMSYGLITEFMPLAKRGRYLGILGIFAGVGVSMTSLLGLLIIPVFGWRTMFVIGGMGTLMVWYLRRRLPESPRWLEAMGRTAEAEAILRDIERESGVVPVYAAEVPLTLIEASSGHAAPKWVPITVLFSRDVIRLTLMAIIISITGLFGSYSFTGWMPTFFVSEGMSVTRSLGFNAAMMAGYVAGPLLYVFVGHRIDRRWAIVIAGTLSAVFAAIYPFQVEPALIISCGFLMACTVSSFLTLGLGTVPEFFPTEYRFRGGGLAQTCGRMALIASPFLVLSVFRNYGIGGVIGAISGMYLIVTLLMVVVGLQVARERPPAAL